MTELNRLRAELASLRTYLIRSIANDLGGTGEAVEILGNMAAQDREMVDAWVREMRDPAYWSKEVAELQAILLNERGEGDPPRDGWKPHRTLHGGQHALMWRSGRFVVARFDHLSWIAYTFDGRVYDPILDASGNFIGAPTARAAMILVSDHR